MTRTAKFLLIIFGVWGALAYTFLALAFIVGDEGTEARAIMLMLGGLILIWIIGAGSLMVLGRHWFAAWAANLALGWRTKFVVLCTTMALLEEAVTTSMSNLGPWLGSDTARITASTNYLEVVCLHSVVIFIPMFMAWGWMLSRYDFKPTEVMLLYGITGLLAESLSSGPTQFFGAGIWIYIYGLMVYLPSYSLPPRPDLRPVGLRHWLMGIFLPIVATVPFVPLILLLQQAYAA